LADFSQSYSKSKNGSGRLRPNVYDYTMTVRVER